MKSGLVEAGEIWTTLDWTAGSTTANDTRLEAAPTIAPTSSELMSLSAASAAVCSVVPESSAVMVRPIVSQACICCTARSAPFCMPGPNCAKSPVCGRTVPTFSSRLLRSPPSPPPPSSSPPPPPQAETTASEETNRTARENFLNPLKTLASS